MDTESTLDNVIALPRRGGDWARVERYLAAQHAPTTRYIYGTSWRKFEAWCGDRRLRAMPAKAETVAMFLAGEADLGRVPSTLSRHAAAIRKAHADQGLANPAGAEVVRGLIRGVRRVSRAGVSRKAAATDSVLARLIAPIDHRLRGRRTGRSSPSASPAPCGAARRRRFGSRTLNTGRMGSRFASRARRPIRRAGANALRPTTRLGSQRRGRLRLGSRRREFPRDRCFAGW